MAQLEYYNDITRNLQPVEGSDGRMNVSARVDGRAAYNSRFQKQSYSFTYEHQVSVAGEYSFYIKNTSSDKTLVISSVGINSDLGCRVKLWFATGDVTGGTAIVPANHNKSSSNDPAATMLEHGNSTAIGGLDTPTERLDYVIIAPNGHEELRLTDRVRLGQNDAILLEVDEVTSGTPDVFGVVFGYFE